jgi:hypothetical protein
MVCSSRSVAWLPQHPDLAAGQDAVGHLAERPRRLMIAVVTGERGRARMTRRAGLGLLARDC